MENDTLSMRIEIESLTIGDVNINGANIELSTDDSEIANKIMYLLEIAASIISMKGRCKL